MKNLTTMAAFAACLCLPAMQTQAASAAVHLGNLNFSVIDLLPDDGIAPSFAFSTEYDFSTLAGFLARITSLKASQPLGFCRT
ncbi:MAG: hypothetical protein EOP38_12380 [Rubrivivax sp.]|nr:MAG: hypothetical protein EOP38_12380 [Rubrivivax sp.]